MSETTEAKGPTSQKLHQVKYLGKTSVSKHCSSVVVPWVIEELRLKKKSYEEGGACWFTTGLDYISVVKEDGQQLLKCLHKDVVSSNTSPDSVSFALVVKEEEDECAFCHGFSPSNAAVTAKLVQSLKMHASLALPSDPIQSFKTHLSVSSITKSSSTQDGLNKTDLSNAESNGRENTLCVTSLQTEQALPVWVKEFSVHYAGSLRVRSPNTGSVNLDKLLDRLKKLQMSKRAPGAGIGIEECDSPSPRPRRTLMHSGKTDSTEELGKSQDRSLINLLDSSESLLQDHTMNKSTNITHSSKPTSPEATNGDDCHVLGVSAVVAEVPLSTTGGDISESSLTPSENSIPLTVTVENTSEASNGTQNGVGNGSSADHRGVVLRKEDTYVHDNGIHYRPVRVAVDTVKVMLRKVHSDQVVLEKKIATIACCAQGKVNQDHFCFVSKETSSHGSGSYYSHIFRADNTDQSYDVLDAFRASFLQALTKTRPGVLCPSCPLLQLYLLCKELENHDLTTAQQQTKVNEALLNLSDKDYGMLMDRYKSKNLESEHEQLVTLVALYRKHLEEQQKDHSHSSNDEESSSQGRKMLEKGKLKSVSRLERAKQSVASSLESIRSKVQRRNSGKGSESTLLERQNRMKSPEVKSPLVQGSHGGDQKKETSSQERKRSSSMPEDPANVIPKEERPRKSGSMKEQRPPPLNIKSVGLPSSSEVESTSVRSHALSMSSTHSSNLAGSGSFSEPSSPVMSTPPEVRHRRQMSLVSPATVSRTLGGKGGNTTCTSLSEVTPTKQRSWRQAAFDSATPHYVAGSIDRHQSIQDLLAPAELKGLQKLGINDSPKTRVRKRWQFLIEQQIMLNRMNKLNRTLFEESQVAEEKRIRLSYHDPTILVLESVSRWDEIFQKKKLTMEELKWALFRGVPPHKRGQVWAFLLNNHVCMSQDQEVEDVDYGTAKEGETEYQQTITMDLGRTFPTHPYFCEPFKKGQKELYNVLHAYSVADQEVGYCQGMSYIAGIFLIHSQEEKQAFKLFYHYMYSYGFREHYKKNMFVLQVRMYQLSCQIHEYLPKLHAHLEEHNVSTYLIAAPWFLTMFSSQYPFAFVSRVMDLVMYEGLDAFFKVSLALLTLHEDALLQCSSMEAISEFVKTTLPETSLDHLPYIMTYYLRAEADFSLKLKGFETEYHVLHDLKQTNSDTHKGRSIEEELEDVKKQNSFLIDQVAMCCGSIRKLETQVKSMEETMSRMETQMKEKDTLLMRMAEQLDILFKERRT